MSGRRWAAVLGLAIFILGGCGTTPLPAPVRDAGKARGPRATAIPDKYRVQRGDTLYQIAFDHGLDYRDVAEWNRIADPDRIYAGATLRLRPPLAAAQKTRPVQGTERPAAVDTPAPAPDRDEGPDAWVWPVQGKVIAAFNETEGMKGIDIAAPFGAPVLASATGRVVYAGEGLRGYGKLIIIRHSKSLLSAYAHQSRLLAKEGERVTAGQKIGEVGDTDAQRAKLHFEIRENGRPVSPHNYLPG